MNDLANQILNLVSVLNEPLNYVRDDTLLESILTELKTLKTLPDLGDNFDVKLPKLPDCSMSANFLIQLAALYIVNQELDMTAFFRTVPEAGSEVVVAWIKGWIILLEARKHNPKIEHRLPSGLEKLLDEKNQENVSQSMFFRKRLDELIQLYSKVNKEYKIPDKLVNLTPTYFVRKPMDIDSKLKNQLSCTIYIYTQMVQNAEISNKLDILARIESESDENLPLLISSLQHIKSWPEHVYLDQFLTSDIWEIRDASNECVLQFGTGKTLKSFENLDLIGLSKTASAFDKASIMKLIVLLKPVGYLDVLTDCFNPNVFIGKPEMIELIVNSCSELELNEIKLGVKNFPDCTDFETSNYRKFIMNASSKDARDLVGKREIQTLEMLIDDAVLSISVKRRKKWNIRVEGLATDEEDFEEERIIDCY